jgi:hypothetical protein
MRFGFRTLTYCGVLLLAPVVLVGQGQSFELGVDGGLSWQQNDRTTTRISIPIESLRFGLFVFNRVSIEPSLALTFIDGQNTDPITSVSFWLSGLLHITGDRSKLQPFVRPTGGWNHYSNGSDNFSQFKAGSYVGMKIPVAEHLSLRLESGYLRGFESDDLPPSDEISLNFGISLFGR